MKSQILRKIQMDIRNNFGKNVDWNSLPKGSFNCFMFAIKNTIPTEEFDHQEGEQVFLKSLINENVAYFGKIGQISGQLYYSSVPELKKALKCDLKTLGIIATECSEEEILEEKCIKIAFYANTEELIKGKMTNFHFIRQEGNEWFHKNGWNGCVEELDCPIGEFSAEGLELISYFSLSLIHNNCS